MSAKEIAVYQAWLQDFYNHSTYPQKMQYVETGTSFYGQEPLCDQKLLKDGVNPSYLRALRDLGTASYLIPPFDMGFARTFDPYVLTVNGKSPEKPFIRHIFSRVVFSRDGKQAFLNATYIKGPGFGQGGTSDDLLASQDGQVWHFRTVGCVGIID
ncbi:MAG TPA: hypothetical protein VK684_07315 [Edaphobacter sp.]|nr:hypothetical protein [Edaphobacter sp.]